MKPSVSKIAKRWIAAAVLAGVMVFPPSPALAEETIKIAAIYAFTGITAAAHRPSIEGVRLGVMTINREGGVLGKRLELMELDNTGTAIGSKIAAEKAADSPAVAIIGALWSTHSIAVAKVAQDRQIPMLSNASTLNRLTAIGDYIFRVCYNNAFQGRIMADFARKDLSAAKAVILEDITSDYSMEMTRDFKSHFSSIGGTVTAQLQYRYRQEHYHEILTQMKRLAPDVFFVPGYDESGLILREAAIAGIRATPLGADGWGEPSFFRKSGQTIKKAFYCTHWSRDVETAISRKFVRSHDPEAAIPSSEALAYDAVFILADAVARAGSTDRKAIRLSLSRTENFEGVTGVISFNESGDPIKGAVIMEINGNRARYLKKIPAR